MNDKARGRAALPLLVGGGLFLSPLPAQAADYVGEAVAGLQKSFLHVSPAASLTQREAVEAALRDKGVAVVALPQEATETFSASQVAASIHREVPQYTTVVVVVEGRTFGVASTRPSTPLVEALYKNFKGDAGEALLQSRQVLVETRSTQVQPEPLPAPPAVSPLLPSLGGGFIVLVAAVVAGALIFRKRPPRAKTKVDHRFLNSLPQDLQRSLKDLEELGETYRDLGMKEMAAHLASLQRHAQELFTRVKRKSGKSQYELAAVKYTDTFQKLALALSEDYYLDIKKNSTLWADPAKRLKEVEEALVATDRTLVKNIQQVNANEDLEIKVALESLTRSMDHPALETIYRDK